MRWYLGYPVLALGLVIGGNTLFPGNQFEFGPTVGARTDDVSRQSAPRDVATVDDDAADDRDRMRLRLAAFSPGAKLAQARPQPARPTMFEFVAQAFVSAGAKPARADPAPIKPVAPKPWKSSVVHLAANTGAAQSEPTGAHQKALLAREVQRELQRVGCYGGEIDGIWGPGSQRAVMAFMERVNAVLPVDDPDVFMLSLLAAEPAAVCGTRCPHGQALSQNDRCLPTTLLAQGDTAEPRLRHGPRLATRPQPDVGGTAAEFDAAPSPSGSWHAVVAEAESVAPPAGPSPFQGRMGLGAPAPEAVTVRPRFARTASLTAEPEPIDVVADDGGTRLDAAAAESPPLIESRPVRRQARAPIARTRPQKRAKKTWRSNSRQVQRLFQHPLGTM